MQDTYIISWKCKSGPACGRGAKHFNREDAEILAQELNEDYPNFIHEALNLAAPEASLAENAIIEVDFRPEPFAEVPSEAVLV